MAMWQGKAGRTDGVTCSGGKADRICKSIVISADGGVLLGQQWSVSIAIPRNLPLQLGNHALWQITPFCLFFCCIKIM